MYKTVQIRLREAGKIDHFKVGNHELKMGDYCILEHDRGEEYGQVMSETEMVLDDDAQRLHVKCVLRKVTIQDKQKINENKALARKAHKICLSKIEEHKLPMKLVNVEYAFDKSKLIFYFTAEGRVDFRELVKKLAQEFKTRIELRQIGVRDEAKILGGIGCCGRALCCATFLKDFEPVNIRMAKDQRLPLNPSKISGLCGRLLCCLKYEHKTYKKLSKNLPKEGTRIATDRGQGKVVECNIIKQTVRIELENGNNIEIPVGELRYLDGPAQKKGNKAQPEKGNA